MELRIPQLGVNDEWAMLIEWVKKDGESVSVGEVIALLETTKAVYEMPAPTNGRLFHLIEASDEEIPVTKVIGRIE